MDSYQCRHVWCHCIAACHSKPHGTSLWPRRISLKAGQAGHSGRALGTGGRWKEMGGAVCVCVHVCMYVCMYVCM